MSHCVDGCVGDAEESVQVSGENNVNPVKDFDTFVGDIKHSKQLLRNISECGFQIPTTVQQYAMPGVRDGQDMYVIAPTGSGKTLAFLLPGAALCGLLIACFSTFVCTVTLKSSSSGMLLSIKERAGAQSNGPCVLVLNPTRELAAQSYRVLKLLISGTGISGSLLSKSTAAGTNFSAVDILIATPLLLVQMLRDKKVRMNTTSYSCMVKLNCALVFGGKSVSSKLQLLAGGPVTHPLVGLG